MTWGPLHRVLSAEEINQHYQDGLHGLGYDVECVPPPSGLVSWWPGDENADDIWDTNHGTVNGAIFSTGRVGQAFSFDGLGDYVEVLDIDNPTLDIIGDLTIDAWVKFDSFPSPHSFIVSKDAVRERSYALYVDGGYYGKTGQVGFIVFKSETAYTIHWGDTVLNTGQWYHIAGTYDYVADGTSVMNIFIDGNLDSLPTPGAVGPIYSGTANLQIGARQYTGWRNFLDGNIDEVEIFSRALDASEIQDIYNAGSAGKCKVAPVTCPEGSIQEYVETVTVPSDGSTVTSGVLDDGVTYFFEASGTYAYWPGASPYGIADAEYSYRPASSYGPGWVLGDDAFPPTYPAYSLDINVNGSNVFWGNYNPAHVYTMPFIGTGSTVGFSIYDSNYDDNSGSLTVDIYKCAAAPLKLVVETEKAKVCWHHDDLHVEGKLSLPEGVWLDDLDLTGSAVITLAGVKVTDQSVDFELKGKKDDKWEYKDKETLDGIKEFKIDWKGAKFDYKGDDGFHIHTHFIAADETTLCIHTGDVSEAFTVTIDETTTIAYDAGRSITTDLYYEAQKGGNTHVHFTLPFQLTSETTIEVNGTEEFDVADYYKEGVAKFKLVSAFDPDPDLLDGTESLPDELEYEISLGDLPVSESDLIEAWTKQDDKHWESK